MSTPQHLSTIRTHRSTLSAHEPKHAVAVARDWHPLRRYLATGAASAMLVCAFALPATAFAADDFTETVTITAETENVTKVIGNVNVENGNGVEVSAVNRQSADVTTGSVTTGASGTAQTNMSVTAKAEGQDSSATVTVKGDVESGDFGILLDARDKATVEGAVTGDISAGRSTLQLEARDGATVKSNIEGNISATNNCLQSHAWSGSTIDATIEGDLSAGRGDLILYAYDEGTVVNTTVNGSMTSEQVGISANASDGGTVNITVNGDITASGIDRAIKAGALNARSTMNITVNGNVKSATEGAVIQSMRRNTGQTQPIPVCGTTNLSIDGDLTGRSVGLYTLVHNETGAIDALVTGTISGGVASVAFDASFPTSATNLDLTVWKIELNEGAAVVGRSFDAEYKTVYTQNEEFEKTIKYIVKVEQPEAGATLSATDAAGNPLPKSHDYGYALEGQNVLLKVNLEDGYTLKGAYNGLGEKASLLVDDAGNYYVVVPKGGGIYLSVELEKVPKPAVTPEPAASSESAAAAASPLAPASSSAIAPTSAQAPSTGKASSAASTTPATGDPIDATLPFVLTALTAAAASTLALRKRGNHERR